MTASFLRRIAPDWSGTFAYSREEDTPAYDMPGQVSKKIAAARAEELAAIQEEITAQKLSAYVGTEHHVLIEELFEDGEGSFAIGRTWFQAPEVDGATVIRFEREDVAAAQNIKPGEVVRVKITGSRPPGLVAEYMHEKSA
jgi:ribosomal protein S12 methylthiotransferase